MLKIELVPPTIGTLVQTAHDIRGIDRGTSPGPPKISEQKDNDGR
jgi:hypothetical protein